MISDKKKYILIKKIFEKLFRSFSYQGWWPIFDLRKNISLYKKKKYIPPKKDIFEISIGAILTQNVSWKNVEKALLQLKKNNYLSPHKIIQTKNKILYLMIKSSGYYKQKTKRLKIFSKWFLKNCNKIYKNREKNNIQEVRNLLIALKGIGKETADSILLYAFAMPIFVIDIYTKRIYSRVFNDYFNYDYDDMRQLFEKSFSIDFRIYNEFHALMVKLAKEFCLKKKPLCEKCPIGNMCSFKRSHNEKNDRTYRKLSIK